MKVGRGRQTAANSSLAVPWREVAAAPSCARTGRTSGLGTARFSSCPCFPVPTSLLWGGCVGVGVPPRPVWEARCELCGAGSGFITWQRWGKPLQQRVRGRLEGSPRLRLNVRVVPVTRVREKWDFLVWEGNWYPPY